MSENTHWKIIYKIAGIATLVFIVYSLVTMISLMVIGGQPETAADGFAMLQENHLVGMLHSQYFSKATAIVGILTFGMDLVHILVGIFAPQAGVIFMMVAGPLYLVWFPLLARDFFKLAR